MVVVIVSVGLPVSYVLSIGPASFLGAVGVIKDFKLVQAVYRPVFVAGDLFPSLGRFIFFWINWWESLASSLLSPDIPE